MTDAAPLAPGTLVGRYRLEQPLALGGPDGTAYRGHDAATQRRVVILEFLPPGIARRLPDGRVAPIEAHDRALYAAGLREIEALAHDFTAFRHANVVPLLECYAANDTIYLVSELPDGRTADQLLNPGDSLLPEEVQEILPSLLAGTNAIHQAGLLHLDIGPASIWIRRDGTAALGRAHLIRRTLGVPEHGSTAPRAANQPLQERERLLRDSYRAEEYFSTAGRLGPWTDIYALAATLYRFVVGTPPHDPVLRRRALTSGQADPVGAALDAAMGPWPVPLMTAIRHGIALAPENRPQSISALHAALGAAGQGDIPTVPIREPAASLSGIAGAKPVFPDRYPEDAPTVRMERRPALERRTANAPVPARAEPASYTADPDATKPLRPLRPSRPHSDPAPRRAATGDTPSEERPTVRMTRGAPLPGADADSTKPPPVAPPIVAPPPLPPAGPDERKTTVIYRRGRAEVITAPPQPPAQPAAPASDAEAAISPARFSVFSPMLMAPSQWFDLAVYIHEPGLDSFVRQDHLSRYEGKPGEIPERRSAQRYSLKPGAAVTVVPRLPGCRVNPPAATAEFWENFHRRSFRVMAAPGAPGYAEGHHTGIVQFFVGPLLVGEARMAFTIGREKAHPISNTATLAADTFDAVFPAYAPQDGEIADRFAAVAAQMDSPFLAEVLALRRRDWDRELLKRIEAAEKLQLFWSPAASRSPHLEEEWKFALALGREHFLRACYWRHPAPGLPPALAEADVELRYLPLTLE